MKNFCCKVMILLCLLPNTILAQKVIYSDFDKFDFRTGEFSVIGKVGGLLYVYRGSEDGYYLDAYNTSMGKEATVVLDFLPERVYGIKFITYTDKMLMFYQQKQKSITEIYGAVLDKHGRLQKGPEKITETKSSLLADVGGAYQYSVSTTKNSIGLYYVIAKGEEITANYMLMGTDLVWNTHTEATFTADKNLSFGEAILGNNNNLYLPVYTQTGGRRYADQVWLLTLGNVAKEFISTQLPLNSQFAGGTYMELDKESGDIYIGGFYSDKKNGNFEGVLFSKFSSSQNEFTGSKFIKFTDRLRVASGERNEKRAFNDYQVKHLIVKKSGGFVLIAEDYYVTSRNNYAAGFGYYSWYYPAMATSVREYSFGDILLASYDENGKQEWTSFVRKSQYSQEDGGLFSSHSLVNTGASLGFIYNDFNISRSRVQLTAVDAQGDIDTKAVTSYSKDEPDWLPRSGKQVSANEFIAPCLRRNEICFAKIVF